MSRLRQSDQSISNRPLILVAIDKSDHLCRRLRSDVATNPARVFHGSMLTDGVKENLGVKK